MQPHCRRECASCDALAERVVVADGAMGTMLQADARSGARRLRGPRGLQRDPQRHAPDVVARHPPRLLRGGRGRRRDQHLRREPAQPRRLRHRRTDPRARREGRRLAREVADEIVDAGPAAVRARLGRPGHEAAHAGPRVLRAAARRLRRVRPRPARRRRPTRWSSRPARTCCRSRPRCWALRRAMAAEGRRVPIVTHVTVETTGTMLLGSEIGAALTAIEPLGVDLIGLNCATGPAEMSEHLRTLAKHARIPLSVMPNAGLPRARPARRGVPADPGRAGRGARRVRPRLRAAAGRRLLRHDPGAHPRGRRGDPVGRRPRGATRARSRASARSTPPVPFRQDTSVLMVGERTNANGSQGVPRGDARRATGRTASRSPASRPATART